MASPGAVPIVPPAPPPPFGLAGDKGLVFTITTGRSGTELLARALNLFPRVCARHEPKPTFSSVWRAVLANPRTAREFWLDHKLPRIARERGSVYCETSHLACKGFLESLLELGARPALIVLAREPRDVAESLWRLNDVPGRTLKGLKYYVSPWDVGRHYLPLDPSRAERLHDYQLCLWYALELEQRAKVLRARLEPLGARFVDARFEDIRAREGLQRLAESLGLPPLSRARRALLERVLAVPVNARPDRKRSVNLDEDERLRLERELRALLAQEG